MAPAQQQYYQYVDESEEADSFAVVETKDDELRVTEKVDSEWQKPFWMPLSEFEELPAELVGSLTSDQYLRVCEASGVTNPNA